MANCASCGRDLPAFTLGEVSDLCSDCRARVANDPSFSAPAPAPSRPAIMARTRPPVTTALIGINVAVFVAMLAAGVSAVGPKTAQLLQWGADWGPLSLGTQPWRMLTSNYLHIGIIHILLNMWCLWNLGGLAELIFDRWTYLLIYLACGLGGSLGSLWWHPLVIGAGASGAIFGMAGALIAALYLGRLPIPKAALRGTLKSLLTFAGYNLFFGAAVGGRIDNSAHIGGLVTGLALGALLAQRLTEPPEVRDRWRRAIFVAAAVVLLAAFTFVKQANGYVVSLERGLDAVQRGDLEDAVRNLEEFTAKKPQERYALAMLGSVYYQKQDYAKAESTLKCALALNSEDVGTQYNLGLTELKLGNPDQAILHLQKALQIRASDGDIEEALGNAYRAKGMQAEAESAFKKAEEFRKAAGQH
jgi:rhomboid protease GluP